MQTLAYEAHAEPCVEQRILESLYKDLNQRLGRPAGDLEICDEMKITLDEFHQMLNRVRNIDIGSFRIVESPYKDASREPLLRYIPNLSETGSYFVFRESDIKELLARAIEELPRIERLVTSLFYYDELTLKEIAFALGTSELCISRLHTKATLRIRSTLNPLISHSALTRLQSPSGTAVLLHS